RLPPGHPPPPDHPFSDHLGRNDPVPDHRDRLGRDRVPVITGGEKMPGDCPDRDAVSPLAPQIILGSLFDLLGSLAKRGGASAVWGVEADAIPPRFGVYRLDNQGVTGRRPTSLKPIPEIRCPQRSPVPLSKMVQG